MALRITQDVTILSINDRAKPATITGKQEGRLQKRESYRICRKLPPQQITMILRELQDVEGSGIPVRLEVIPQKHGPNTIMGLA